MNREFFTLQFQGHNIIGDIMGKQEDNSIFFLHGAGQSDRNRYTSIRYALLKEGFSSIAFDFIGHGDTGGDLSKSCLRQRTEQACYVIDHFKGNQPLTIIGSSMSGYTSIKLLKTYNVANLIILVPAAYDRLAYNLRFNSGFTECIRKKESYLNSDAWDIVKTFKGQFLLINAESDQVIPYEIIKQYYNSAVNAKRKVMTITNSPHGILKYLETNEEQFNLIVNELLSTISCK